MTLTATLRLPIASSSTSAEDARRIDHQLRELNYHPEQFLDGLADGKAAALVREKREWIATAPTPGNARQRCRTIRRANEALQPWLAETRKDLLARREQTAAALRAQAILSSREYAFCLYPSEPMQRLMHSVNAGE
jgi:hypothetical protein